MIGSCSSSIRASAGVVIVVAPGAVVGVGPARSRCRLSSGGHSEVCSFVRVIALAGKAQGCLEAFDLHGEYVKGGVSRPMAARGVVGPEPVRFSECTMSLVQLPEPCVCRGETQIFLGKNWDGIVRVRGQRTLCPDNRFFVPAEQQQG